MQIQQVNRLEVQINRSFPDAMLNVTDRLIIPCMETMKVIAMF
ncbi:MAG: hypothetical protein ACK6CP_20925 [Pseudanabaena sp.]